MVSIPQQWGSMRMISPVTLSTISSYRVLPMPSLDAQDARTRDVPLEPERLLLEAHPSRWNFFWYYFFFFLLVPPLVAMWKRSAFILRVYTNRISVEKRRFSRDVIEIFCTDVSSVEVRQSFCQRVVDIGDVIIGNAASNSEEVACGVPDPNGIKNLILSQKRGGIRR
jgi:hypothetical protein